MRDDSRILAEALESAAEHTLESYPGWAWWVDNVDAYLGLALADEVV
ncbi:MAG TPA: hypothetical protein PK765_00400 [bacterium]|nr:hypothetical protein [bacterium]